jgi:DnaK suppressor protein
MKRIEQIAQLKGVLQKRRDAIRRALEGDLSLLRELEQTSGDVVDWALDAAQDELSTQLAEVEAKELEQIEKALHRMEEGTYGICEVTGKSIPIGRLRALPYATMCIEAQRQQEAKNRNPLWNYGTPSLGMEFDHS